MGRLVEKWQVALKREKQRTQAPRHQPRGAPSGPRGSGEGSPLASAGCGPERGDLQPLPVLAPPALGHPAKPGGRARASDEGFPRALGPGQGQPRSGGRNSPWREARQDCSAGWNARPVSGAPRAGALVGGGGGRQEEPGRVSGLDSPHPFSSRLFLPPHPRRCAHTLLAVSVQGGGGGSLLASTRPQ